MQAEDCPDKIGKPDEEVKASQDATPIEEANHDYNKI